MVFKSTYLFIALCLGMSGIVSAQQAASNLPDAKASDPKALGIMQGFPPAPNLQVKFSDGSMWAFPKMRWSFSHVRELGPTSNVWRGSGKATDLPKNINKTLDQVTFTSLDGQNLTWEQSLALNYTDGILVMHKGKIVYEKYFGALNERTPHIAMSMTKSFVGTLAAMLAEEGKLDTQALVTQYVPELKDTVYADATVRQVMDMTISVQYSEKYSDPKAEIWDYIRAGGSMPTPPNYSGPRSLYEFLQNLKTKDGEHGNAFAYKTPNAEVLGWIVQRASGKATAELLSERIWQKLGTEEDAYFSTDSMGTSVAGGGLNTTLRDLARVGEMFRLNGKYNGQQIVPASVVADIRHGANKENFAKAGYTTLPGWTYRNMWWIAPAEQGVMTMRGIHGQTLWIDSKSDMVIARYASNPVAANPANDPISLPAYAAIGAHLRATSK